MHFVKNFLFIISLFFISSKSYSQNYVNKEWELAQGNPSNIDWVNSITTSNNDIVTVGNTATATEGTNISIICTSLEGQVMWQNNFNSSGAINDYGIDVVEDNQGQFYIVGVSAISATDHDVVIIKCDDVGGLLWSSSYSGVDGLNDIPTDVKLNINGDLIICGLTQTISSSMDYLTLCLDQNNGSIKWSRQFDNNNLFDAPISIESDNMGNVIVAGSSADNATDWDYTVIMYDSLGNFVKDSHFGNAGIGLEQAFDFKKDLNGNYFVAGKSSSNGIDYDFCVVKIDSNFNTVWTKTKNKANKTDCATALALLPNGEIAAAGYVTDNMGIRKMLIIKYDANGNELFVSEQNANQQNSNAEVKSIKGNQSGDIYFLATEYAVGQLSSTIIGKLGADLAIKWRKENMPLDNEIPVNIHILNDNGIAVNSVIDGVTDYYSCIKYIDHEINMITENSPSSGKAIYLKNQLVVRFQDSVLNTAAIDNLLGSKETEFEGIDYYLKPSALIKFNNALADICQNVPGNKRTQDNPCGILAFKIFKELRTTQTTTVSRMGEIIPVPKFWSALILEIPDYLTLNDVRTRLYSIPDVVVYTELNLIGQPFQTANDPGYQFLQMSLHPIQPFPNADINVEEAWDVIPTGGLPFVKCGIFDAGLRWSHLDFGYNNTTGSTSKVLKSWDFITNSSGFNTLSNAYGIHGTSVAGIIGALRNNSAVAAGIAGGNYINNNKGSSLYDLKIQGPGMGVIQTNAYNAIVTSAINDPNLNNAHGLNIANHSWGISLDDPDSFAQALFIDTNFVLLTEAMHFANRAKVTNCVARGNFGKNNLAYPATIDDDWILNVGGTGNDGQFIIDGINGQFTASYGKGVDIGAPAGDFVATLGQSDSFMTVFPGTSAAAPHASGVVALLMSYLNDSVDNYKNLAPEDCEQILQRSAKDDTINIGVDSFIGHGLLDAGKAMRLVEKPYNTLAHFGTNSLSTFTKSVSYWSTDSVQLTERYQNEAGTWFPKAKYKVETYKIDALVNHSIPANDTIVAVWPRPSSSTVLDQVVQNQTIARERVRITSYTNNNCQLHGFVYKVFDTLNNYLGWWPFDTTLSKAKLEYTILSRSRFADPMATNSILKQNKIRFYPNPASTKALVFSEEQQISNLFILDISGKIIKRIDCKASAPALNYIIDLADLSVGTYFCRVEFYDKSTETLKFVKQ